MNIEKAETKTGVVQKCYYGKTKYNKPYCNGEISVDKNISKFFFIIDENNPFLLKGDIINFNIHKNNNELKIDNIKLKDITPINLDWKDKETDKLIKSHAEIVLEINKANSYLALTQMLNPYIKDNKGYNNSLFHTGMKLREMWNHSEFAQQNQNFLLQVTTCLLIRHPKQSKNQSGLLIPPNFKKVINNYDKIIEHMTLNLDNRFDILKSNFNKSQKMERNFQCSYLDEDHSLLIMTHDQKLIQDFIIDNNLSVFSQQEDNISKKEALFYGQKTVDNQTIYSLDIPDSVIFKNTTLKSYISLLKNSFDFQDEYDKLNEKITINQNNIIRKPSI